MANLLPNDATRIVLYESSHLDSKSFGSSGPHLFNTDESPRTLAEGTKWIYGPIPQSPADWLSLKDRGMFTIFNISGWSIPMTPGFEIINYPLCFESLTMPMTEMEQDHCEEFEAMLSIASRARGVYLCGKSDEVYIVAKIMAKWNDVELNAKMDMEDFEKVSVYPNQMMRVEMVEKYGGKVKKMKLSS